jgi:ADP-ribose pyrophosphatase YjhB (NUDIX family)
LWQWGPNFTADSVVLTDDAQVLLIQRGDTGAWALPGGFRDYTGGQIETAKTAAARELTEETGLKLDPKRAGWLGHLVCDDLRATAHAWIETDGFCWRISAPVATQAGDDALDAGWFSLNELPEEMSATHTVLIRRATADLKLIPEKRRT